jgi:hypothetical protein
MEFVNNHQNPNGTWYLYVTDLQKGIIGKVIKFSLEFGHNPATILKTPCNGKNPAKCFTSNSKGDLLPDLIVVKDLTQNHIKYFGPNHPDTSFRNQLRFAAAMANIGQGPFEIKASNIWKCGKKTVLKNEKCDDGSNPKASVSQIIYRVFNGKLDSLSVDGGQIYFDNTPGHNHYHVNNWVDYFLLKKKWWTNNPLKWKVLAKSTKVSYCLFDNLYCDDKNNYCKDGVTTYSYHNLPNFGFGNFHSCNSSLQGISVGGIDYYGMYYEGQSIHLPENIKKGSYYLMIHVDPLNIYKEVNKKNNIFLMEVKL